MTKTRYFFFVIFLLNCLFLLQMVSTCNGDFSPVAEIMVTANQVARFLTKTLLLGLDVGSANDDSNFFRWIRRFEMKGSVIDSRSFLLDGCRQTCRRQPCSPRPTSTTDSSLQTKSPWNLLFPRWETISEGTKCSKMIQRY